MITESKKGMIVLDILLALSLAGIFTMILTQTSVSARETFERANLQEEEILKYENGGLVSEIFPYGNDRIQEVVGNFEKVRARSPEYFEFAGTPLCTVNFPGNSGNSESPEVVPINLPINPLLPLTDIEVRNGIAYISADSNIASDPDLLIIDFTNRSNPILISSLNTGPGIGSISLAGTRIFGAARSTASQLHVIKLNSLSDLVIQNKIQLPLPHATATPPFASSIFYNKGFVYLGTEKWAGNELNIFDVSIPGEVIFQGSFETGSKINDIYVSDNKAYVAASDEDQLRTLDISNPSNPTLISTLSPSGWERQEGKVISKFQDYLIFGRTSGGFNITKDHELFDDLNSKDIPGGVYGIIQDRKNIFVVSRDPEKEFQILSRHFSSTTVGVYFLPVAPQTLACDGDRLYILAQTAPIIYEILFK